MSLEQNVVEIAAREENGVASPATEASEAANQPDLSLPDGEGEYPYDKKISRAEYEARKKELQIELLKMQNLRLLKTTPSK